MLALALRTAHPWMALAFFVAGVPLVIVAWIISTWIISKRIMEDCDDILVKTMGCDKLTALRIGSSLWQLS